MVALHGFYRRARAVGQYLAVGACVLGQSLKVVARLIEVYCDFNQVASCNLARTEHIAHCALGDNIALTTSHAQWIREGYNTRALQCPGGRSIRAASLSL